MPQPVENKQNKDLLCKIEKEFFNYKFYLDFLNISNSYELNVGSIASRKLGMVKLIDSFINKLPEHLQEFFMLRYKEDNTIEKTAEKMNITPRTCYRYRLQLLHKFKIFFDRQ